MTNFLENNLGPYSHVLMNGLKDVAAELRTIDLVDMASYIRFGSYATLEDLVHSSIELFFKAGTLSFGWSAGIDLTWGEPPVITMGMEFRHAAISAFFDLTLRAMDETVTVCAILFEEPIGDPADGVKRLEEAIATAKLPRRAAPWSMSRLQMPRGEEP